MDINNNTTVDEIVVENYNLIPFFQQYHIDFCCKGKRSTVEMCNEKSYTKSSFETMSLLINTMYSDYDNERCQFIKIVELTDNYKIIDCLKKQG